MTLRKRHPWLLEIPRYSESAAHKAALSGDKEALARAHLRLVVKIAFKQRFRCSAILGRRVEVEDLYEYGLSGLAKAVRSFDVSKGYRFATYAWLCIQHSIIRECEREHHWGQKGAGWLKDDRRRALPRMSPTTSMRTFGGDAGDDRRDDLDPITVAPDPTEWRSPDAAAEEVQHHLARLPADLRALVRARYLHGLTTYEIADAFGIPQRTAHHRLARAMSMLQEAAVCA